MSGAAIGVDLGTSGIRVALVDRARDVVALVDTPIAPQDRRDPARWWSALGQALISLRDQADLRGVTGIAVDGTSGTILPVDAAGVPLAPASLYNDRADLEHANAVAAAAPETSAAHGATSPLARALPWRGLGHLAHLLHEADWLAGRLTGRWGVSDWNNALKTGFDPEAAAWPAWLGHLDIDPAWLPDALPPGAPIGTIDPRSARALGLPEGAVVHAGTTDGCAAFLATGADGVGDGVTALGTTLTVKLLSDRPILAPRFGIYSHRLGERWLPGGASNTGGAALLRHFSLEQIEALSRAIDGACPSALDYYPLAATGERFPVADPSLQSRHEPRPEDDAAFLHGLLEGIARIEARAFALLAELGAPKLRTLFSTGGGARNRAWTRIRERLLGVEMRPPRAVDAAVGAAGLALPS